MSETDHSAGMKAEERSGARILVIAVGLFLLLSIAVYYVAQPTVIDLMVNFRISGRVIDSAGRPLEGLEVVAGGEGKYGMTFSFFVPY